MYAFLFDRRSLALLVAGVVALGALLFFGGMMVGMGVEHDRSRSVATPQASPATVPAETFEPRVEPITWRPADSPSLDDVPASTSLSGGTSAPPPSTPPPRPPSALVPAATPPPPPTTGASAPATTSSSSDSAAAVYWAVQLGAFESKQRAQDRLTTAVAAGWTEFEITTQVQDGVTYYKPQWGCWPRSEAKAKQDEVQASIGGDVGLAKVSPPDDSSSAAGADPASGGSD